MLFRLNKLLSCLPDFNRLENSTGKRNLICTRPENVFTAVCWPAITTNSGFMRANFSPQSELRRNFRDWLHLAVWQPVVFRHCRMFVALDISTVLTWRHPLLPQSNSRPRSPMIYNIGWGLRSLSHLSEHPTARADDSHAAAVLAPSKESLFPESSS